MHIVREQMLCIIVPNWSGATNFLTDPKLHQNLRKLLQAAEIIHFASIALLPNRSDDSQPAKKPSLMLELTVDEGIAPQEVLRRLTTYGSSVLWDIYKNFCIDSNSLTEGEKNAWLLNHLLQGLSIADGAYLGPRDRSIQQVLQERELYKSAQKYAQSLPLWERQDRTTFALRMVHWSEQIPNFDWAREPAARSFWRENASFRIITYMVTLIGTSFILLWVFQGVFKILQWLFAWLDSKFKNIDLQVIDSCLGSVVQFFSNAIDLGYRSLLVLLIATAAFGFIFMLLPALFAPWRRWLNAVGKEIDRPSQTWSSQITYVFTWLLFIALLILVGLVGVYIFFDYQAIHSVIVWLNFPQQLWLVISLEIYLAFFIALALILIFGLQSQESATGARVLALGLRAKSQRWFQQPFYDETTCAQQVHTSIEACEAALVGHTAHMISLTELRTPYWWNCAMAKISLRVVTFLGYTKFTEGSLSGAPGIQYSHWHLIDGGRRLLFCANFDGTFGGYLDDFIKGPSNGVNMFWRWTHLSERPSAADGHPEVKTARSYPPTRLWLFRGAKCELKFKAYARESMLPHLFRFEACNLSMDQKNRATVFRNALFGKRTDANDDVIMRVLET